MDNIQVILYTQGGVRFDVGYIDAIPVSLNFVIADIRKPEARNASASKTINLPGSKEVNEFFELIWETNTSLNYFNPNLKCPFYYYVNSVEQMRGDLQLLKITVDDETGSVNYEVQVTGRLGTLFKAFGDTLLTDLDFSEYDHDLTKANVTDSWATQIQVNGSPQAFAYGTGYTYPLIDYGYNNGHLSEFHVKHLRMAMYKKTILDKCFDYVGKSYTSSYFTSTYYKHHVMPATEENILLSASDIADSQFYARRNANQTGTANAATYGSAWTFFNGTKDVVLFNEDNVAPYNDAGAQYATGTGVFTVGNTNNYNVFTKIKYDLVIANTVGTATNCNVAFGQVYVYIQKWNGSNWTTIIAANNNENFSGAYASLTLSGEIYVPLAGLLTTGELYRVVIFPFNLSFDLYTSGAVLVTTGTTTMTPTIKTNSTYAASLQSTVITEGYTVEANQSIPTNLKIVEWLTSEFKLGNLYMDIDKTNSDNFIIEDRDNFYSGEVDWTDKRDISKKREVIPMGELDWKQYDFMYKTDADEFNQAYFGTYKEVFGSGKYEVTNDFITGKTKQELIYAATPIVGNAVNGLVIPKLYKNDNGVIKNFKALPRNLYYNGLITLNYGSWTLKSASGDTTYTTTYPFAGDCDNPTTPTLTINWDTPKAVYYNYILATYTDNNLKNRYYTRFINQITDKNSKIEKRWYNLNADDIESFDFRKVVFDTDAYFIVNAIKDYDVLKNQSTLVELLKLADYDAYVPSNVEFPLEATSEVNRIITGNYSNGTNNNNYGTNSHIVGGSGNYIAIGAQDIQLTNCTNVVVNGDVSSFRGVGLSNTTVTNASTNTTSSAPLPIIVVTSDVYLDTSYHNRILLIDATASNITIYWDYANMENCVVTIIRGDATGNIVSMSDVDLVATVIGNPTPYDLGTVIYDSMTFTSVGSVIYVI